MMGEYVETLISAMGGRAEMKAAASYSQLKQWCNGDSPDIIHVHGCWRPEMRHILHLARKTGARIVVSPHGQLQPWVMAQYRRSEKLPKAIFYQRRLVARAYAVVAMGRMEEEGLRQQGWNVRIETVRNALITETITKEEMACQMLRIYNKVYDTATRHYMQPSTVDALRALVKVGITGDARFIDADHTQACQSLDYVEWRKILLYAYQESILGYVALGIQHLHLDFPDLDPSKVEYFQPSAPTRCSSSKEDESQTTPTTLVADMIIAARTSNLKHRLAMQDIVKIANALFHYDVDEDELRRLCFRLKGEKFVRRLMQLLSQETLLDEGYLIAPPLADKQARRMIKNILKQNEI